MASASATQWINHLAAHGVPILIKTLPANEAAALEFLKQGAHDYVAELSDSSFGILAHKAQQLVNFCQSQRSIAKREPAAAQQGLLAQIADRIYQSSELQDTLAHIATDLQAYLATSRIAAYCLQAENGEGQIVAIADTFHQFSPSPMLEIGEGAAIAGLGSVLDGRTYIIPDLNHSDLVDSDRLLLQTRQVGALVAVPIRSEGSLWGVLVAEQWSRSRPWLADEVELLNYSAAQISLAIQKAKLSGIAQQEQRRHEAVMIALANTTEMYAKILAGISDAVIITNKAGKIAFIGPNAKTIFGYSESEIMSMGTIQALLGADLFSFESLQKNGEITNLERRIYDKANHARELLIQVKQIDINHGAVLYICHEITQQKNVEHQLRQSEDEFRLLVEHLPTGIVVHGPETHILTCNSKATELLGLTKDQMQGKSAVDPAWHFFRDDGSPLPLEEYPVNQVIANQKPINNFVAGVYRPAIGNYVWLIINAYPFFDHNQTLEKLVVTFVDISAQKQAQLKLKASEQRYASLAQAAPVGIFRTDPDGNCTYVNDRWSSIAGLSFDSAQGQGWIAGLHPDDRAAVTTEWCEAAQNKRPFRLEYRFQTPTGAITWVYGQAVAERDDQGIVTGYVGTVTDITDRYLAEEKRQESEARYRLLFQEANDMALMHPLGTADQPGQYFTDVNETTCQLLGYSLDELRQMTPLDLIPDEEIAEVFPEMEVLTETGQLLFEKTLIAKDGTRIPVELHAHVFDWQGKPTVLSIARDIRERKAAQAELEARESLFRSTFEQAAVGMAQVSSTGHFIRLNQRFCTIVNYPPAELINLTFQDITHPDDLQVDVDQVNRLLAGEDNTYSIEKRYICKGGTIVWVNLTVALVRDHAGEPDYFITVVEDISDRKAAQERLRLALISANQGIYDLNLKTDRVIVEPEYALMLDYEPSGFSETVSSWRKRVHPEDRATVAAAYRAYAQGKTHQYRAEFRLRTRQGTWKWILSIGKFVEWDAAGQPVRLLGTHTDIDERKRAEIALRNSEARFRQTFEHMGVGMCVCNPEGVFVRINQRFCEITGYTAAELVGMSFVNLTHADDLESDLAQMEQLLLGQRHSYTLEKRYICKDQTVIWVNLTASLLKTADGEAQQFMGAIEDITARKLAEAELQTLNRSLEARVAERTQALADANANLKIQTETLHQTNQLLTLVMDSIPQRIFWKDRNSVLLGCNHRFAQDLGLTIESAIGKRNLDLLATPEQAAFYDDGDRQVMDSGEASLHTIETRRRSDGSVVHLDTSKVPLRNGEGQVIGLLSCYEDITQRRRLEANIQRQLQKEQMLSALVQRMRQTLNAQETFHLAVTQVRSLLGIDRVLIYVLNPDRSGRVIAESVASGCPSLLRRSFSSTMISPKCFQAYASGEIYSVADAQRGNLPSCIDPFSQDIPVRAKVLVPIVEHGSKQVWGLLIGHHCDRPHRWQPWELELLRQLSQHLAIAVRQIKLYDQLQQELRQRRQAEQSLRASEARLQLVTDSVNGCIAYVDAEQRYQFVNHTYEMWFGRQKADILGCTVAAVIGPSAYAKTRAYVERALAGETVTYEAELPYRLGGPRYVSASLVPDRGSDGQINGYYVLITDISNRKQAEEYLEIVSTRLNLAVASADIGIWDWDITRDHLVWDARMHALYGTDPHESGNLYQTWLSRVHPEDQAYAEAAIQSALKEEGTHNIEFRVVHPDQSVRYIKAHFLVKQDTQGRPYRMTGINYDITEQKRAEAELRDQGQREKLLRELTQRIRQSLDLTTIFATACDEIRAVLQCDRVGIFKFDLASHYTTGEFCAESRVDEFATILGMPVQDHCFGEQYAEQYRQGRYLISADIFQNGISPCHADILERFGVRACMVMPLMQGEALWGLLCVHQCGSPRAWQPAEIDLVHQLSIQMAIAIQQAHLYKQTQSELQVRKQAERRIALQLRQQQTLASITQRTRETLDVTEFLGTVTQQIKDILRGDRVIILRLFDDGHTCILEEAVAPHLPTLKEIHSDDEVWSSEILQPYWQGKPRIVPDVMNDRWTECLKEYSLAGQIQSKVVAPILQDFHSSDSTRWVNPGQTTTLWGLLIIHACQPRQWKAPEAELLQLIANQVAIAIQQSTLFERLQQELLERQHAQQQLTERNEQLARATHMKDEFLANMSHEIRTPMNGIIGMTKLALETSLTTQQRSYLSKIDKSASVLLHLINDILDFSKIEAGKLHLEQVPFFLEDVLINLSDVTSLQAEAKNLELLFNVSLETPLQLTGDSLRLGQILLNLVSNAIKFTEAGHILISVSLVTCQAAIATLRFAVEDTGIGLSEDQQSRLFQAFSQGDASTTRRFGGTGLGLVISKRLVSLMQGEIGVESTLGAGSTFWFTATFATAPYDPSLRPQPDPIPPFLGRPALVGDTSSTIAQPIQPAVLNQVRVLLVEDHEINQDLAMELLTQAGAIVTIANNGQEACDRALSEAFDVVLMDCQMPVMDGYEATQHMRTTPQGADLPIIAMTANAMQGDREKCLQVGMNDYLVKPIVKENLYSVIQRWVPPKQFPAPSISPPLTPATPDDLDAATFAPLRLFDTTLGLYYVNDNPVLYRKLLLRFLTQQADFSQQIEQAMVAGDLSTVLHLTHSLKGLSGTLGCKTLQTKAARLENILREQEDSEIDGALAEVVHTLAEVLSDLETWALSQQPAPPPPQTATLDWAAVTTHCHTMAGSLEVNLGEAMTNLTFLQETLWNVPDAYELVNTLTTAIDCFDIGAAKNTLQNLVALAETHS